MISSIYEIFARLWLSISDKIHVRATKEIETNQCGNFGSALLQVSEPARKDQMEKPLYFRRCHVCGQTNSEHGHNIDHCSYCGKPFAKFHYFDDRTAPVQSDFTLRPPYLAGEYIPIQGLTVYWESF